MVYGVGWCETHVNNLPQPYLGKNECAITSERLWQGITCWYTTDNLNFIYGNICGQLTFAPTLGCIYIYSYCYCCCSGLSFYIFVVICYKWLLFNAGGRLNIYDRWNNLIWIFVSNDPWRGFLLKIVMKGLFDFVLSFSRKKHLFVRFYLTNFGIKVKKDPALY